MEIYIDLMRKDLDKEYFNNILEEYCEDYGIDGIIKLKNILEEYILSTMKGE